MQPFETCCFFHQNKVGHHLQVARFRCFFCKDPCCIGVSPPPCPPKKTPLRFPGFQGLACNPARSATGTCASSFGTTTFAPPVATSGFRLRFFFFFSELLWGEGFPLEHFCLFLARGPIPLESFFRTFEFGERVPITLKSSNRKRTRIFIFSWLPVI